MCFIYATLTLQLTPQPEVISSMQSTCVGRSSSLCYAWALSCPSPSVSVSLCPCVSVSQPQFGAAHNQLRLCCQHVADVWSAPRPLAFFIYLICKQISDSRLISGRQSLLAYWLADERQLRVVAAELYAEYESGYFDTNRSTHLAAYSEFWMFYAIWRKNKSHVAENTNKTKNLRRERKLVEPLTP